MLAKEIDAFERLLPTLLREHGAVWAVMVGQDFKGAFRDFAAAAEFAVATFPDGKFLIRHTDMPQAHIPFIAVED